MRTQILNEHGGWAKGGSTDPSCLLGAFGPEGEMSGQRMPRIANQVAARVEAGQQGASQDGK